MRFLRAAVTAVLLLGVLAPFGALSFAPVSHAQDGPQVNVEVTKVTPELVSGQQDVTVTGVLTNRSDYQIDDVETRIERGAAVQSAPAVQEAMRGSSPRVTQPNFVPFTDTLSPGERKPFELHVPLSGTGNSLAITEPGSYPLVVNVNGTPSYGSRARVGEASFLLPVVSTPEAPPAPPAHPMPTTMLVPLIDYPRVEDTEGSKPILTDDQLGSSLSSGGRLFELVRAVQDVAGQNTPLAPSMCFAIDPDLLVTVDSMRNGYRVRQPDGSTREGVGARAAGEWLDTLREATKNRCVISLPFADADVVALGRADLPDLIKGALDGAGQVRQILHVEPRTDAFWPIDGALDEPAASALSGFGVKTMFLNPSAVDSPSGSLRPAPLRIRGSPGTEGSPVAMPIDPLLAGALGASEESDTVMSPQHNRLLSAQNTLGALAYRATEGAAPDSVSVLAPPRRWNLRAEDLRTLLSGMEALRAAGYIEPTGLRSTSGVSGPQADLSYPMTAAAQEIQRPILDDLARENFKVGDLFRSSSRDPAAAIEPAAVTTPLRNALLRGASSAWRGSPAASREWVAKGTEAVREVLSAVQVHIPAPGTVTMSASNSPIPVKVSNSLPITVRVVLHTPRSSGIRIKDLGVLSVPQGGRSFWPGAEAQRAGRFTVDITASTEAGTKLGTPKRLQVESSNYGALIPILTTVAGALLVVLSAIRIARRIRGRLRRSAATDGDATAN